MLDCTSDIVGSDILAIVGATVVTGSGENVGIVTFVYVVGYDNNSVSYLTSICFFSSCRTFFVTYYSTTRYFLGYCSPYIEALLLSTLVDCYLVDLDIFSKSVIVYVSTYTGMGLNFS
jgi:hypothetical protein